MVSIKSAEVPLAENGLTFHDGGGYLSSDPKLRPSSLHCDHIVGLLYRVNDGSSVKWADGTEVDDLTAHTLLL